MSTFEQLMDRYLHLVASGENYVEGFKTLGKLELYQEFFPSSLQEMQLNQLPMLIDITSVSSPYIEDDRLNIEICFDSFTIGNNYSLCYTFDFQTRAWAFVDEESIYSDGQETVVGLRNELLSKLSPINHPLLYRTLEKERKKFDCFFEFEHCAFSEVYSDSGKIFFSFEGFTATFIYDPMSRRFSSHKFDIANYLYTKYITIFFEHLQVLEQLQNHPSIRLKSIFQ